jgi:hypothetical protein
MILGLFVYAIIWLLIFLFWIFFIDKGVNDFILGLFLGTGLSPLLFLLGYWICQHLSIGWN